MTMGPTKDRLAPRRMAEVVLRRGRWHGRRLAAAVLLAVSALAGVALGSGWPHVEAPVWSIVVALTAVVAAMTLATFVAERGAGRLVDLGCGSCAVVAAVAPVLAVWWVATSPVGLWSAVLALGVTAAALGKRLTDPVACAR